jgi:hypothetical protein
MTEETILKARSETLAKAAREFVIGTMERAKDATPVTFNRGQQNAIRSLFVAAFAIVDELQSRIGTLEALDRASLKYVGTWRETQTYQEGNLATDHGSLFYCNTSTTARPVQSRDWTLCVKRGRDGKDAK